MGDCGGIWYHVPVAISALPFDQFPTVHSPAFHIRDVPIYGRVILSPMDGYSDLPFRLICRELGSAMSYTEDVSQLHASYCLLRQPTAGQGKLPEVFSGPYWLGRDRDNG